MTTSAQSWSIDVRLVRKRWVRSQLAMPAPNRIATRGWCALGQANVFVDDACFTRHRSAETGTRVGRVDQWVERSTLESRAFLWMPVTISRLQRLTRDILLAGVDCWGASPGGFERGSILLGVHHPDKANSWKVRRGVIVAGGGRIVHMKVAPVVATHQSSQS